MNTLNVFLDEGANSGGQNIYYRIFDVIALYMVTDPLKSLDIVVYSLSRAHAFMDWDQKAMGVAVGEFCGAYAFCSWDLGKIDILLSVGLAGDLVLNLIVVLLVI